MTLIPRKRETLISAFPARMVISRLSRVTQPALRTQSGTGRDDIRFNGHVGQSSFKISRKVNYPQNYLPLIKGSIEETSRGCIIFLSYRLFFSSLMFFMFWTVVTFLIGTFFLAYAGDYLYASIAFGSGIINYLVTVLNFNKQVKLSRKELNEVLNVDA